jgi:hypothetical protein
VIDAVAKTQGHASSISEWVDEVEASISSRIADINSRVAAVHYSTDAISAELTAYDDRIKTLERKPDPVIPLVPDINPLRNEVKLLRSVIDEMAVAYNEEMTTLWSNLREIHAVRKDVADVSKRIDNIKIPDNRWIIILSVAAFVVGVIGIVV